VDRTRALYAYDDWEGFREQRINQIHARTPLSMRLERTDGKVIDCSTVPLPDGATLITYLDVTDSTVVERSLRERNEALTEADRLKTQFLANVSYELRSPLTSISGFSDMLRQEYFGELTSKQREYVEGIHQSSQHLMQLVNDILDLASIEAGYMQLDVSELDIHAMMKSVLALTQERAREHKLSINLVCNEKIGKMRGDETRLKQSLFNLLSNAIRFTPSGGHIEMGAKADEGDIVRLWVRDDGPGIPEADQAHVFDKFYKGLMREKGKGKTKAGTGLGLSMVKSFIELHGGRVDLASAPGKGTTISCLLPRKGISRERRIDKQ
jgi:signal transduction histidine kinase